MPLSRSEVQELYTKGIDWYKSFIGFFQLFQALQALLKDSGLIRPGLSVLDAGCGFGMVTFALLGVLRQKNFDYRCINAFDLTPAMLTRFQQTLKDRDITKAELCQADVLALGTLPTSWARGTHVQMAGPFRSTSLTSAIH